MNRHLNALETGEQRNNRPLLALAAVLALVFAFSTSDALANESGGYYRHAGGGYTGPGPAIVTVEQAKSMRDDARVALKGHIIQNLGGEKYVFKDSTGAVNVEIDAKRWQGQNIGPDDLVEIYGEVDKDWSSLEIEVERIIKR